MMQDKYSDQWREWITIRTRNRDGMTANIFLNTIDVKNTIARMIVDDVTEVTPVALYTFPDSAYHTVRLLLKNPAAITRDMFRVTNYCINYCRLPYSLASMSQYALRGLGGSQACTIIFKNPVPPTRSNNGTGMTVAKIYVPDEALATYKADANYATIASKIYAMSTYTSRYY